MITGQGTQFTWGTVSFGLTSISVEGVASETEITSMSSKVTPDPEDPQFSLVTRDYDCGLSPEIKVSVEFVGSTALNSLTLSDWVGRKKILSIILPGDDKGESDGFTIDSTAILSQMSLSVSTGDYVRGNASFRLSGL